MVVKEDSSININPNVTPFNLEREKMLNELIYSFIYTQNKELFIQALKDKETLITDYVSLATWHNWEDAVQYLIDNFEVTELDINDAFQVAVNEKYKNIVDILIKHPKFIPSFYNNIHLISAICSNYSDVIELILNNPKTVNEDNYKCNILNPFKQCVLWSISHGRLDLVKLLVERYKISPRYSNNLPLAAAAYYKQYEILEFLTKVI
jgi:hypothetical protein